MKPLNTIQDGHHSSLSLTNTKMGLTRWIFTDIELQFNVVADESHTQRIS